MVVAVLGVRDLGVSVGGACRDRAGTLAASKQDAGIAGAAECNAGFGSADCAGGGGTAWGAMAHDGLCAAGGFDYLLRGAIGCESISRDQGGGTGRSEERR